MLSSEYNHIFSRGVDEFSVNVLNEKGMNGYKEQYTLFYPLIGRDYGVNKWLLVIGQATNGWQPKFSIDDVRTRLPEIIQESISYSKEDGNKCPLEWINENWSNKEFNLYRSFFWRITYKLIKSFYNQTDENWNNIVAWSNLMKIAPFEKGNPDNFLIEAQMPHSAWLFIKELEDLKPNNVLVMTNLKTWAKPILDYSGIEYEEVNGAFVEAIANYKKSKIIITKRGYLNITHDKAINEVSSYFVK